LAVIADEIRLRTGEGYADITEVMAGITQVLDKSIGAEGFSILPSPERGTIFKPDPE
jgi:hypothetical protein